MRACLRYQKSAATDGGGMQDGNATKREKREKEKMKICENDENTARHPVSCRAVRKIYEPISISYVFNKAPIDLQSVA